MVNKENSDIHPENDQPQASSSNEKSLQLVVSALSKIPKSKSEKRLELLHVIFAGCMVIVTLSLAFIGYKQWQASTEQAEAAKKQTEAAKKQVEVAEKQVEVAKEQAVAARNSVEASKNSAEAAKQAVVISEKALKRTEEMFALENRPYLLISAYPFDDLKSYYFTELDRITQVGSDLIIDFGRRC